MELYNENKHELILMNINLGFGLNRFETAIEIGKARQNRTMLIPELKAYAFDLDREEFLKIGLSGFLPKLSLKRYYQHDLGNPEIESLAIEN